MNGLIIDNFAGGGGASTGLEAAFGRPVDVAINHDEAAIAVHAANHPTTRHLCQSIMSIDPLDATEGKPVLLVWFSPDCKHHSKAKGGKPRDKNIRDLATIVPHWLERLKKATPGGRGAPLVIMLENVEEFRQWGPLDADGMPIKERRGEEFKLWVARIKRQGYKVEWRELRACDYGAPTSRKRLFLNARRDGMPIVWPEPTHGKPGSPEVLAGTRLPWRTAAECIDWSIPCPSIFDRKRDLKPATCRRIAAGVMRYVVNSARPFIVPITHTGGVRVHSVDDPLRTITTAKRGELAVAVPHIATLANRDKPFTGADEPMHTVVATGCRKALVATTLVGVGGRRGQSAPIGVDVPHPTITTKADGAIAAASLVKLRNHSDGEDPAAPLGTVTSGGLHHGIAAATMISVDNTSTRASRSFDVEDPLRTVTTAGGGHASVAAFLHKYRPNSDGAPADDPMPTVTANSFVKRGGGAPPLAITSAHLEQANTGMVGHDMREPLSTIVGKGCTQRLIETTLIEADALPAEMMERAVRTAAFLVKYYGTDGENEAAQVQSVDRPMDTITVKARFAVVTVTIDAVTFVLVDIGMRMLEPRELANAQGFPADYILAPVCWYQTDPSKKYPNGQRKYGPLPKSHQIAKIGNSVCPVMSEALARANCLGSAVLAAAA
ncbi:DNA cytosine methyltransferase [Sphingomonas sp. PAMC 26605]|uniref:DNA cytosine methyltransferase n=1 Tax=Sphingomonas sp. PAMC 26605 TaxID=1112214 RepID=UPI00026CD683|nr:DNA cytosine methyltransferase [Sphingomonas sp. PAMC 26605]